MISMEQPTGDLYGGVELSPEELRYKRSATGKIETRANNLWMNLQSSAPGADRLSASQLKGASLAEKIKDEQDRKRFTELSLKLGEVASWELTGDARWAAVTSEAANDIYLEMYQIARRNGISNSELLR